MKIDQNELYRSAGCMDQLAGARRVTLTEGMASGMRAVQLYNAAGMEALVLPDRCLDIAALRLCGQNLGFLSKTGLTSPAYFQEDGARGFLRSFYVGFLTTCGLSYMGAAGTDEGEPLGLHGRISNTPAYDTFAGGVWNDEEAFVETGGSVRQAQVFAEHLVLNRHIRMQAEENILEISDTVENRGFQDTPFMLLYHMNYGYPLLSPDTELFLPTEAVMARDAEAAKGIASYAQMERPQDDYLEQVFLHRMRVDSDGMSGYVAYNRRLQAGVCVRYSAGTLPYLTEWKCMRSGEYVLGLEPGNCHVMGRAQARKDGILPVLHPQEKQSFRIVAQGLIGHEALREATARFGEALQTPPELLDRIDLSRWR